MEQYRWSYRWIHTSYKYMEKKKPEVSIIFLFILLDDEARPFSPNEIKALPTCLHVGVPQGHVVGTFVTVTVVSLQWWQQSHALRCLTAKHRCCKMEKRKKKKEKKQGCQSDGLAEGWHKSKSQEGLQNDDLNRKTLKWHCFQQK